MFWYILLGILFILSIIIKSPWFKGKLGEGMANFSFDRLLDKNKYHLIKNVTLSTEDGSTQIDHVIVSIYGIFVVETKNMKGWIFGSSDQKMWTQKIYKRTSRFQNPLFQNYKHVKTLQSLLGLKNEQLHSVVVFTGETTFKTEMPENVICGGGRCARFIMTKTKEVFTREEIAELVSKIHEGRLTPSFKTDRRHVAHVREIVKDKKDSNLCPRCGSPMVLREIKKGENAGKQFWGCSKFPRCKGIVEISSV